MTHKENNPRRISFECPFCDKEITDLQDLLDDGQATHPCSRGGFTTVEIRTVEIRTVWRRAEA